MAVASTALRAGAATPQRQAGAAMSASRSELVASGFGEQPERIVVSARCGPVEPTELQALLWALAQLLQGMGPEEIRQGLLGSHASTRAHMILRHLLPAISKGGLESCGPAPTGELALRFIAGGIVAVRTWVRDLEALRTPFRVTIGFGHRSSGALMVSWAFGFDTAAVGIVGDMPGQTRERRRPLSRMRESLAR